MPLSKEADKERWHRRKMSTLRYDSRGKGQRFYGGPPKLGKCSSCGKDGSTQYHHINYNDFHRDPFANTVELCLSCHRKEHRGRHSLDRPPKQVYQKQGQQPSPPPA